MPLQQFAFRLGVCALAICVVALQAGGASAQSRKGAKQEVRQNTSSAGADGEQTLIGQYAAWGAYVAAPGGKKVCFALGKPTSMKTNPPNRARDPAYVFITTRPQEKVVNELSVKIGYPLKAGSEGSLEVSGNRYALYTEDDGLWIKNAAEEEKMIEALRKGSDMVIKGTSSRGTATTDSYSLKGLTQALERIGQECRR